MNSVSLLFYAADVISNLKPVMTFLAVFTFVLAGLPFLASIMGYTVTQTVYYRRDKSWNKTEVTRSEWKELPYGEKCSEEKEGFIRFFPRAKVWGWLTVPLFIIMMVVANALPSRETIFAIATSEFVEDFSQTQAGTEIGELANETLDYLKSELKKLKGE